MHSVGYVLIFHACLNKYTYGFNARSWCSNWCILIQYRWTVIQCLVYFDTLYGVFWCNIRWILIQCLVYFDTVSGVIFYSIWCILIQCFVYFDTVFRVFCYSRCIRQHRYRKRPECWCRRFSAHLWEASWHAEASKTEPSVASLPEHWPSSGHRCGSGPAHQVAGVSGVNHAWQLLVVQLCTIHR